MHSPGEVDVYRIPNIFAPEARYLYFIADPRHLLKTAMQELLVQ